MTKQLLSCHSKGRTAARFRITEISCGNDTTSAVAADGSIFQWGLLEGSEVSFYPLRIVFDFGPQSRAVGARGESSKVDDDDDEDDDGGDEDDDDGDEVDDDGDEVDREQGAREDSKGEKRNKISHISCGGIYAIALSSTGELFSWDATGGESESNMVERHSRFFGWLDAPPGMHGMMSLIGAGDKYLVAAAAGAVGFQSEVEIDPDGARRRGAGGWMDGSEGALSVSVAAAGTVETSLRLKLWLRDSSGRPVLDPEDEVCIAIRGAALISRTFCVQDVLAPSSDRYSALDVADRDEINGWVSCLVCIYIYLLAPACRPTCTSFLTSYPALHFPDTQPRTRSKSRSPLTDQIDAFERAWRRQLPVTFPARCG